MEVNQSSKYLASRLKEVLTEGKWVTGTNVKALISNLEWKRAIWKPEGMNSMADLTFHLGYYISGVLRVLKGGPLDIRDQFSFQYEPVASPEDWQRMVDQFCLDSEVLIARVEALSEEELATAFAGLQYGSTLRNIDALIEHTYYHFGQMVLLTRLRDREENS